MGHVNQDMCQEMNLSGFSPYSLHIPVIASKIFYRAVQLKKCHPLTFVIRIISRSYLLYHAEDLHSEYMGVI